MIRALIAMLLAPCAFAFSASVNLPFTADATPTPEVVVVPSGYIGVITVTGSLVNVRATPSIASESVGKVKAGAVLPLVHEGVEWVRVVYQNEERWMLKSLVKVTHF